MAKETSRFVPFEDKHSSVAVWPSGVPFPMAISNGEARFEIGQHGGGWRGISKVTGLAISQEFPEGVGTPRTPEQSGLIVYGVRTMSDPRESGYQQEGHVSIGGKKYSAFTSSHLFSVNGKLVDVGVLFVRTHDVSTRSKRRRQG